VADLPNSYSVPVLRADFTDDALWLRLQEVIRSPTREGFLAHVEFVEDRTLTDLTEAELGSAYPRAYPHEYPHPVLFIVDGLTVSSADHSLIVVNLNSRVSTPPFRTLPRHIVSIQNNLSIANMDFFEFARAAGADRIFRGFQPPDQGAS
jgi:hypothetical protein